MALKQIYRTTMRKTNGDLLTPILLFSRLQGTKKFLLESSSKYEELGRYSFIGANPRKTYSGQGTTLKEISHLTNTTYSYDGELITLLKQVMPRITSDIQYPFTGGAIGHIYDQNGNLHVHFQVYDTLIIFDHLTEELIVVHTNIEMEQKEISLDDMMTQLLQGEAATYEEDTIGQFNENQATFSGSPFSLYRKLRVKNPAPYMFYLELEHETIIGTAPTSLMGVHNGRATAQGAQLPTIADKLQKLATIDSQSEQQIIASLHPTTHAIDALATVVEAQQENFTGAIGYIGFNGQLDFAHAPETIFIKENTLYKKG